MSSSNGYFSQPYQSLDPRQIPPANGQDVMDQIALNNMDTSILDEGQTLDEIINQNNRVAQRRRDTLQPQYSAQHAQTSPMRRESMVEFGTMNDELADFQFDARPVQANLGTANGAMNTSEKSTHLGKNGAGDELGMDMKFPADSAAMNSMNNIPAFDFDNMDMDNSQFDLPSGDMHMDLGDMSGDLTSMNMQPGIVDASVYSQSPNPQSFLSPYDTSIQDQARSAAPGSDHPSIPRYSHSRQASSRPPNNSALSNTALSTVSNYSSSGPPHSQPTTMNALTQSQSPRPHGLDVGSAPSNNVPMTTSSMLTSRKLTE
ncbi:MAG: hypothetical protein Q9227_008076 [Pyrenula ochraceoflavens]